MIVAELTGVKEAITNLKKRDDDIQKGIERGLKKAGLLLQGWSQMIVPVDTGLLKNSAYTRVTGKGANTSVFIGYTASYAIYVHENLDALHGAEFNAYYGAKIASGAEHSRGADQQARFLVEPAIEHRKEIKDVIAEEAKRAA